MKDKIQHPLSPKKIFPFRFKNKKNDIEIRKTRANMGIKLFNKKKIKILKVKSPTNPFMPSYIFIEFKKKTDKNTVTK